MVTLLSTPDDDDGSGVLMFVTIKDDLIVEKNFTGKVKDENRRKQRSMSQKGQLLRLAEFSVEWMLNKRHLKIRQNCCHYIMVRRDAHSKIDMLIWSFLCKHAQSYKC